MEKEELNLDQLEVGEWYELKGSADWLKWFSKHKGIHDGNCEISSEFIQKSSGLDFKKHAYTWCSGYTFRKATKEQLKSFLPKDHPDYPIENSDYKWLLILQENTDCTDFEKGAIAEIDRLNGDSFRMKRYTYDIMLSGLAEGKIKPFLTKEEAEKYWDSINVRPVVKPVETPKTKQLSDLKKGDWVKYIFDFGTSNFKENNLYKLTRDWDNGNALIIDANGNSNGFGNRNIANFTVPTQQEIETWEKSLIEDEPKEFVLPEKWCINKKVNCEVIGAWFNKNSDVDIEWRNSVDYVKHLDNLPYLHYPKHMSGSCTSMRVQDDYTEITFKQFEKYVLKSKVEVEDKPKETMKTIPKYWYIENKYQEVRDYLADTYKANVKEWKIYTCIGFDGCGSNKGCHGGHSQNMMNEAVEITIEQFREYFLSKPKEVKDDYSWWYELEAGDVIESLTDVYDTRKKGDRFAVININPNGVSYAFGCRSCKKEEWRLISKAKDTKKNAIEEKLNLNEFPAQNLAQQQREILTFQKKCEVFHTFIPQPEETEIVPISKYFKIRN